ncbi:hypothetical protein CEXT_494351 [Caerostris extrusa]|nr:hypothetical protein CEXT_494351 [Caerostris extrusa]
MERRKIAHVALFALAAETRHAKSNVDPSRKVIVAAAKKLKKLHVPVETAVSVVKAQPVIKVHPAFAQAIADAAMIIPAKYMSNALVGMGVNAVVIKPVNPLPNASVEIAANVARAKHAIYLPAVSAATIVNAVPA